MTAFLMIVGAFVVWVLFAAIGDSTRLKREKRLRREAYVACEPRRRQLIIQSVRKTGGWRAETGMEAYTGTAIREFLDLPFRWDDARHWTPEERAALAEAERLANGWTVEEAAQEEAELDRQMRAMTGCGLDDLLHAEQNELDIRRRARALVRVMASRAQQASGDA
jgi:hypothetical protein